MGEGMKCRTGITYFLRENVTGAENDECAFSFDRTADRFVFRFLVKDADIISPYRADNEDLFDGDAVEVFIAPQGDRKRYFELEVSPYGVRFWASVVNETGTDIDVERLAPVYAVKTMLTQDGYRAEIELPFAALHGLDTEKYLFNAYRLDKKSDGRQLLYALNPTLCDRFHRPKYFVAEE